MRHPLYGELPLAGGGNRHCGEAAHRANGLARRRLPPPEGVLCILSHRDRRIPSVQAEPAPRMADLRNKSNAFDNGQTAAHRSSNWSRYTSDEYGRRWFGTSRVSNDDSATLRVVVSTDAASNLDASIRNAVSSGWFRRANDNSSRIGLKVLTYAVSIPNTNAAGRCKPWMNFGAPGDEQAGTVRLCESR